ncbi:MAG: Holliday junction branch migration protein RuvA [Candidatus Sumerlaeaceae bacterium]|nr:Holliday junction branch migration protein RuvA [Candidatus Sumerlaeaceae bacterium]
MIEFLRGRILARDGTHIVLECGGVGYGVDVPLTTLARLPEAGAEAELHIYFHMNEQAVRLYGFALGAERDIFEVLLGATGIGPKTALAILSATEIRTLARAVVFNDLSVLTRIPGVGKKTAERLVVELRDRLKPFADASGDEAVSSAAPARHAAAGAPAVPQGPVALTAAALVELGCKPAIAERAALRAADLLGLDAPLEDLVREALKHRR